MITRLGVAGVFVLDYDEAKRFFLGKLGFEERFDLAMDDGMRWLTVGPPADPGFQLSLQVPGPPMHDADTAATLRALVARGALSGGAWHTDDCRATHAAYAARGVEFLQEPRDVAYGVEAVFRDPFGTWYSLNELNEAALDPQAMAERFGPGDA
ncbi:VOC family protein [Streptomonospora salina]|uniref:Catechol 2,3-dioxygenase-like lactoylglutathione lyase family enzyme n=1 Tax=Streptomonospora salina TaxID=104205 RepID=A0A841EF49_9ACTN|nr:VOC family protein [Streptomonospora salina]MBB6000954.1 catechol 2,3-dioxygenase-like lactoylglutathione lyase family enzyme [Streptomonospora salina]